MCEGDGLSNTHMYVVVDRIVIAIAAGGGGGAEGTSDLTSSTPPSPGGAGWGANSNTNCKFEPGNNYKNSTYSWYWPGDGTALTRSTSHRLVAAQQDRARTTTATALPEVAQPKVAGPEVEGQLRLPQVEADRAPPTAVAGSAGTGSTGGAASVAAGCESARRRRRWRLLGRRRRRRRFRRRLRRRRRKLLCLRRHECKQYRLYFVDAHPDDKCGHGERPERHGDPYVPSGRDAATYTGPVGSPPTGTGAAGAGSTTTSTTAGASGTAGQSGGLILVWNYEYLVTVKNSCLAATGTFIQGTGTNTATTTYFQELGPTEFELYGGSGGSPLVGNAAPGGARYSTSR